MLNYFRKYLRSSPQKKKLFFEGLWLSLKYEVFLKTGKYDPIKHLHNLEQKEMQGVPSQKDQMTIHQVSKVIDVLEKFAIWRPKCYNRAMTAKQLLLKRNIETIMHIGFRKKDGELDGHAWLTYNKIIVTGNVPGLHKFNQLQSLKTNED